MFVTALATDYDDTLATNGKIDQTTIGALTAARRSGRKVMLVTGREIEDLVAVCPDLELFDAVVAENGGLYYDPRSRQVTQLAPSPDRAFVDRLREAGVDPLAVGHVIVATRQPHEIEVLEVIASLGLELQIIFNKGAVMVLPSAVNKASGLAFALDKLSLSPNGVVGIGDGENDHAFLSMCGLSVAVANAIPSLKDSADITTAGERGAGVVERVRELIENDLRDYRGAGNVVGRTA